MSKVKSIVRLPVVEFSRGAADDDDGRMVRRRGVIFRSGDYPTQRFAMTPAEIQALAEGFRGPIPLDHGHPTTDGPIEFGRLVGVSASPDGTTLYGEIEAPSWLDAAMAGAKAWRVSASFDRGTKAIRRLSLVTRPQISDAELQAAFACACGHDTKAEETPMTKKEQALARLAEMDDESVFDAILDDDDGPEDTPDGEFDGEFDRVDEEAEARSDLSNFAAEDPEKAELRARLEALERERRRERSASFAEAEAAAGRILPHEKENAAAVMYQALDDDALDGAAVDFSRGGKPARGSREAMVRAAYGQRQPHRWNQPVLASNADFAGRVLDNGGDRPESEQEYAKRLVAKYNGHNRKPGRAG